MQVLERDIERKVVKWCRGVGLICVKLTPTGQTGWPDRAIILSGGRILWIEFKRPGGVISPKQQWVHEQLRRFGHRVEVCDDADKIIKIIKTALQEPAN